MDSRLDRFRSSVAVSQVLQFFTELPWRHVTVLFVCIIVSFSILLVSCASSNVQREAASNVDLGVRNAKKLVSDFSEGDIAESYQNAKQRDKGSILGGTAGAVTGLVSTGIGVVPGAIMGALFGGSYGSYIDSHTSFGDQLENRGGNVIEIGDQLMIVLPAARIFEGRTPAIRPQAYSTLDLVSKYINKYTNTLVKVAVYTNSVDAPDVDQSLTQRQAASIEEYLSRNGTDARLLVAKGEGTAHPIVRQTPDWRKNQNYRIEITLEKLHG